MTITIKDGNVKGSTTGVNVVYFFAILFLIAGVLMMVTGNLAAVVLVIFAITMIYIGFNHNLKVQQKKLDEYYKKYFNAQKYHNPVPISGVECPKCHYLTETSNKYCPNCGNILKKELREEK